METLRFSSETTSLRKLENLIAKEPLLQRAFILAEQAHRGQKRDSGEPYINHCLGVARIAYEEWGIKDPEELAALLLHDTVEDTEISLAYLKQEFGERIASSVDALTKFDPNGELETTREFRERKTFNKLTDRNLVEPADGMKKLADVLHNGRELSSTDPEKRLRNSRKILNFFSPLAESLGMWIVKTELENLAFKYTEPEIYIRYFNLYNNDKRTKEPFISGMKSRLEKIISETGIPGTVAIRENSLLRLKDKKDNFRDINDVISFRTELKGRGADEKRDNCNIIVGRIRKEFNYMEDQSRFDDFYDTPKYNSYSAIHVTLDTEYGAVEIAVTSDEKEDYNNWGIVSLIRKGEKLLSDHALKLVITPTGQAKFLPPEANGLDLAYLINKKLAAQAESITINGIVCPLSMVIPNAADVKINPGPDRIAPNRADVELSRPSTKKKAEKQFKEQKMHEVEMKGREIVHKIIADAGLLELEDLLKIDEHASKLGDLLNYSGSKRSLAVLYRLVKYGVISEEDLRDQLKEHHITKSELRLTSILIEGDDKADLLSFFSHEVGKKHGGNIRWEEGGSRNGISFSIRMVVEGLSQKAEDEIRKTFAKNPNVSKIIVV